MSELSPTACESLGDTILFWRIRNRVPIPFRCSCPCIMCASLCPHIILSAVIRAQPGNFHAKLRCHFCFVLFENKKQTTSSFDRIRNATVNRVQSSMSVAKYPSPSQTVGVTGPQTSLCTICSTRLEPAAPVGRRGFWSALLTWFEGDRQMGHVRCNTRFVVMC